MVIQHRMTKEGGDIYLRRCLGTPPIDSANEYSSSIGSSILHSSVTSGDPDSRVEYTQLLNAASYPENVSKQESELHKLVPQSQGK